MKAQPREWILVLIAVLNVAGAAGGAWIGTRYQLDAHERAIARHTNEIERLKETDHQHEIRLVKLEH